MNRKIMGAYHVATFPGWETLVTAQCCRLKRSGLLDLTDVVHVGIVGEFQAAASMITEFLNGKARIADCGELSRYEFPTLQRFYEQALDCDFDGWYIHTKGVSHDLASERRLMMETVVIDNHAVCRSTIGTYDACGGSWQLSGFYKPNPHFSGNFWWAKSEYLRTLPPPLSLDTTDRFQAEFWIGKNPQIHACCMPWPEIPLTAPSDPFDRPSAWVGLETKYQELCEIHDSHSIRRVVDIGVDYGFTTFHMARDFPHAEVVGVSDFQLHPDAETWVRDHLPMFPNARILVGHSPLIGREFGESIDLLHIDGDHSNESVKNDFLNWVTWVRPGGRVIFHDTVTFSSVRQFFDELPGRKTEIKEHHGLGCWFKDAEITSNYVALSRFRREGVFFEKTRASPVRDDRQ